MGWKDWFKASKKRPQRDGTGFEVSRWEKAPMRRGTRELLAAYKEMPWLRTIADTAGDGFAGVRWNVVQRVEKGSGKPIKDYSLLTAGHEARQLRLKALFDVGEAREVPDHPALRLLADPNDYMTDQQFKKLLQVHLDIVGEAFLALERVGSTIVSMWPMAPSWVTELPDLSKPKSERVYRVTVGKVTKPIPAANVVHLRHLDPDDPLGRGIGSGFALGDELDTDEYAARFTKNSFWNNMVPAFIASIDGLNDPGAAQAKAFKEDLGRNYQGPEKAGKILITSGKLTLQRLDTTFKDIALVDLRKFLMGFVRMTYRIPPEIVGDISSSNRATAFAAREIFAEQVVKPRAEFFQKAWQKWVMPLFGDEGAILDFESPVPADRERSLRVMGLMPSAFSFDEWRAEAGRKPDPERQGYPMPLPGQKPEGNQTPAPEEGSPADEEEREKRLPTGDPAWAAAPLR